MFQISPTNKALCLNHGIAEQSRDGFRAYVGSIKGYVDHKRPRCISDPVEGLRAEPLTVIFK